MFRTVTSFVCAAAVTTAIAVAQSEPAIVTAARTQDTGAVRALAGKADANARATDGSTADRKSTRLNSSHT